MVGDTVRLSCHATTYKNESVIWSFWPDNALYQDLYISYKVINGNAFWMTVEHTYNQDNFDLIIFNAQLNNTGIYDCVENNGMMNIPNSTLLTVTGNLIYYFTISQIYSRCVRLATHFFLVSGLP